MSQTIFLLFVFLSAAQIDTYAYSTELNRRRNLSLGNSQSQVRSISSNQLNNVSLATPVPTQLTSGPFWANASLEGLRVRCSDAQRHCLGVRRVLDPSSGKCYPIGDERPCSNGLWALDANALANGNLLGRCHLPPPCKNDDYRMAFDGQCYNRSYVKDTLCAGRGDIVFHPFGDMECALALENTHNTESTRRTNFSKGRSDRCQLRRLRWQLPRGRVRNDAGVRRCVARQQLPAPGGGCVPPLRRGFCDEGQNVIVDVEALRDGRLRARCAPRQPCGPGEEFLMGKCRSNEDISNTLCPGEPIVELPTGVRQCTGRRGATVMMFTKRINENETDIFVRWVPETRESVFVSGTECSLDDEGNCATPVELIKEVSIEIWIED